MKPSIKSSISGRLIGGFLIVVAMSVLIGAISFNQFRTTETLVSDEVMGRAEARHLNAQIILKSTSVFGLVNDYLLTTEESRRVALRIIIHDGIRTLGEYLRQVKSRKLTVEEREMFSRLEGLFARYGNLTKRVLREKPVSEIKQVVGEFREVHFRFITLLQNFNSIETGMMYDSWDFARKKIHVTKVLILTLSLAILIMGVFFGIVSTRMITVPVRKLINTLEEYGSGNFDVRADATRGDEIGFLADRFNVMLDQIKRYAGVLMDRNVELDQSRGQLQMLTDTTPDAVFVYAPDGRIVNVNQTCLEMFGYSREEMLMFNASRLSGEGPSRGVIGRRIKQAFKGNTPDFEWSCKKRDGEEFPVIARLRRMQIGEDVLILAIVTDITVQKQAKDEKKNLETQLLHAQKMEAVGTLAGGIAHDFNNVLQAISGYIQLLLMRKGEGDPDLNYLTQVDRSIKRAAELVQQLLIFSRKAETSLRPMDFNLEIAQVHKILIKTIPRMVDVKLRLADNIRIVNADPMQIEQIIMNLAVNAGDVMPDGGRLIIETENVVLDEEYCKTYLEATPGEYVLLTVSDTGCGMDRETLKHIFEPFYTTKEAGKGTGLGLAIIYGIVKSHDGHITCYSEPGSGTTFKIYFPALETEDMERAPEREDAEEISGGSETILLVDDEETIIDIGRDILGQHGYTIITAESGEKAVEIYEREGDRIDLVVLDLGMPGMGGHRCLEELLKINLEIKVVIASGYSASGRVEDTLKAGATGFIGKPYQLTGLLKKVREILD